MAFSYAILGSVLGGFVVTDPSADATGDNDVLAASANLTVRSIEIDNTLGATAVYLKLYDNAAPVIGTTAANEVLPCPAGQKVTYVFGQANPLDLGTALSYACTQGANTADTTNPASAVRVTITADP